MNIVSKVIRSGFWLTLVFGYPVQIFKGNISPEKITNNTRLLPFATTQHRTAGEHPAVFLLYAFI